MVLSFLKHVYFTGICSNKKKLFAAAVLEYGINASNQQRISWYLSCQGCGLGKLNLKRIWSTQYLYSQPFWVAVQCIFSSQQWPIIYNWLKIVVAIVSYRSRNYHMHASNSMIYVSVAGNYNCRTSRPACIIYGDVIHWLFIHALMCYAIAAKDSSVDTAEASQLLLMARSASYVSMAKWGASLYWVLLCYSCKTLGIGLKECGDHDFEITWRPNWMHIIISLDLRTTCHSVVTSYSYTAKSS